MLTMGLIFWLLGTGAGAARRMPVMTVSTLAHTQVSLPAAARGRVTVLDVGFTEGSSKPTSAWGKKMGQAFAHAAHFTTYAVAVLEDAPAFVRPMIELGMRGGMSPADQRHFLIVTQGESRWKKLVHYRDAQPDAAYILLLGPHGHIRGSWAGQPVASNWTGFQASVRKLLQKKGAVQR
jgi:hypothetical protein